MICIHAENSASFHTDGLGVLVDFIGDVEVTERIGGYLECKFSYSLKGLNAQYIKQGNIVVMKPNDRQDPLPFVIYEADPEYVGETVDVLGRVKIAQDLKQRSVKHLDFQKVNTGIAMKMFAQHLEAPLSYRQASDVLTTITAEYEESNAFDVLIGGEHSVLNLSGAELIYYSDGLSFKQRRGRPKSAVIRKETALIQRMSIKYNRDELVTRIIPFTTVMNDNVREGENGKERYTTEEKVYGAPVISPNVSNLHLPVVTQYVEFRNETLPEKRSIQTDGKRDIELNIYKYQSVEDLNLVAGRFFEQNPGLDEEKIVANLDTLGVYDDSLSSFGLYDTIEFYSEKYDVDIELKVSEITYNPLTNQVTKVMFEQAVLTMDSVQNRLNMGTVSGRHLSERINKENQDFNSEQKLLSYIDKLDGTRLHFVDELPPVEDSREGDAVFLNKGDKFEIWKFVQGAWQVELPATFREDLLAEIEKVQKQADELNQSLESSEQERQAILERLGASESLAEQAKQAAETAVQGAQGTLEKVTELKTLHDALDGIVGRVADFVDDKDGVQSRQIVDMVQRGQVSQLLHRKIIDTVDEKKEELERLIPDVNGITANIKTVSDRVDGVDVELRRLKETGVTTEVFTHYKSETAEKLERQLAAVNDVNVSVNEAKETAEMVRRQMSTIEQGVAEKASQIIMSTDLIQTEIAKRPKSRNLLSTSNNNDGRYVTRDGAVYRLANYTYLDYAPVEPNTTYTLQVWNTTGSRIWYGLNQYREEKGQAGHIASAYQEKYITDTHYVTQITTDAAARYVILSTVLDGIYDGRIKVQLEKGTTANGWEPHSDDLATKTNINQLSDSIGMSVFGSKDAISKIGLNQEGVKVKGKLIDLDGDTSMNQAFIKKLLVDSVDASTLRAMTANINQLNAIEVNVNNIVGLTSQFIKSLWNGINSVVSIDGGGITINHTNGSKTVMSASGLFHEEGGTFYRTHYLTHVETITDIIHDGAKGGLGTKAGYKWVRVPQVFWGKPFKAHITYSDCETWRSEDYSSGNIHLMRPVCFIKQDAVDTTNGWIPIVGYAHVYNRRTGSRENYPVIGQLIITV